VAKWKKSIQDVKRGIEQELDRKDQLKKESIKAPEQLRIEINIKGVRFVHLVLYN